MVQVKQNKSSASNEMWGRYLFTTQASPALLGILVKNNQAESRVGIFKNTGATSSNFNTVL